jgi:hypothetical protein
MQHVGHALRRMVNVALQVHERRSLLEDTVAVALFQRVHERLLVLVALMDVHVVADADDVSHEGNHVRGLADGLAVCDLGLLLVEDLLLEAEEVAGGSEGEAGTGGVIAEEGDAEAGVEDLRGLVALPQVAQSVGYGKDSVDFVVGLVPGPVEVGLVHVVDAQGFQMSCKLNSFAHDFSPYLSYRYMVTDLDGRMWAFAPTRRAGIWAGQNPTGKNPWDSGCVSYLMSLPVSS